jgi:predicted cupin superfamily sugar epimerase
MRFTFLYRGSGPDVVALSKWPVGGAFLGSDLAKGQQVQMIVPQGTWQGSLLVKDGKFGLMGTTMAPGFDFFDFEAGERIGLIQSYPKHKDLIKRLTRSTS